MNETQANWEERRRRQRSENVGRARKMHAARMAHEEGGALFAADGRAQAAAGAGSPGVHVGCSGWYYVDWRERFYPADLSTSRWFDYYASRFETVELNAPFYSWPTVATVQSWLRQAQGRTMVYSVKVNDLITHVRPFDSTAELVRDFGFVADLLGERMGCLLFQLPPAFDYTAARLKNILGQIDPRRKNVVEFRHRSWWDPRVFGQLSDAGVIFCSCSAPGLPDTLVKTADEVYVRFHGTQAWYQHDYTAGELSAWAQRIGESGARRVWAYFNNCHDGHAGHNALELARLMGRMAG